MKSTPRLILIAIVTLMGVVALREVFTLARGGFRQEAGNPEDRRTGDEQSLTGREPQTDSKEGHNEALASMVERLFSKRDTDLSLTILPIVGQRAVPYLIAALDDPRTATVTWEISWPQGMAGNSPLERICILLEPFAPREAIGPLTRLAQSQNTEIRRVATKSLGNIGAAECVRPILQSLEDQVDDVRDAAMSGIAAALEAKRCDPTFIEAVFPAVTRLLNRDNTSVYGEAPRLLLKIDAERALPILLSPEYLSASNPELLYLIRALNEAGHKVPPARLVPLLDELKKSVSADSRIGEYSEGLLAYARNPDGGTEQRLRSELQSPIEGVATAAGQGLTILAGIADPFAVVSERRKAVGFQGLTEPQQTYEAVFLYDAEVRNGGHSQYFINSSGNHWRTALRGLKAVGAPERAKILEEAVAIFGPEGAPEASEPRQEKMARLTAAEDATLDALDERYYSCRENLEKLLSLYAIENKEHFVSQSE